MGIIKFFTFLFLVIPQLNVAQKLNPKIAYLERTKLYKKVADELKPNSDENIILIIRVEGVPIENILDDSELYLEANNEKYSVIERETSAKRTIFNDGKPVSSIEPYTLIVFSVPKGITNFNLNIAGCSPVSCKVKSEILDELSQFDIK